MEIARRIFKQSTNGTALFDVVLEVTRNSTHCRSWRLTYSTGKIFLFAFSILYNV